MKNRNWLFVAAAFASLLISGCATSPTGPAPATQAQAPLREVPGLKVVNDCGACKVRASVPTLIVDGYRSAASKAGAKLATSQEATLAIKVYSAREDGARFFGALAGKDEIKATVSFKGTQFMVEDYYYTAWLGIEDLAKKIGEMVFEQMNRQAR